MRRATRLTLGPFQIEYLHVTHSTIDCVALAVRTPVGVIIHTGDFKIDPTPVDGKPFDLHAFARYGQEGVLALFSDSTNVERPGFTPSERAVVVRLEELFRAAPERVVVSCFSSSIHRIQQVIDVARSVGRKIGIVGRSMVDNIEIAHGLGKLRIPDGSMVRPQDIRGFDRRKLVVLASGTQAEPMSALSRVSVDNHRLMSIAENDTVILSSRLIPGNEKAIFRMIDHFFRRRVLVYYEGGTSAPIHVSGHASQEEMKILLQLVRPKYFVPLHGEYRHLFRHAALAEQVGAVSGEIFLLESGHPVEFTADGRAYQREPVPAGRVCVDSGSLEEIEDVVIRDRRHLSEDGVVVPIVAIDKHTGLDRDTAGNRHARLLAERRRAADSGQGARGDLADDRAVHSRGENGLERDQGKDPRGAQALPEQTDLQAAVDFAGDFRSVAPWKFGQLGAGRVTPYSFS